MRNHGDAMHDVLTWCAPGVCRKLMSTKAMDNNGLKCAIDHILEAQQKGEINEDNVLYIIENINVAGMPSFFFLLA